MGMYLLRPVHCCMYITGPVHLLQGRPYVGGPAGRPVRWKVQETPQILLVFCVFCTRRTWCLLSGKAL